MFWRLSLVFRETFLLHYDQIVTALCCKFFGKNRQCLAKHKPLYFLATRIPFNVARLSSSKQMHLLNFVIWIEMGLLVWKILRQRRQYWIMLCKPVAAEIDRWLWWVDREILMADRVRFVLYVIYAVRFCNLEYCISTKDKIIVTTVSVTRIFTIKYFLTAIYYCLKYNTTARGRYITKQLHIHPYLLKTEPRKRLILFYIHDCRSRYRFVAAMGDSCDWCG